MPERGALGRWKLAVAADPTNASLYERDPMGRATYWTPPSQWRKRGLALHGRAATSSIVPQPSPDFVGWSTHVVGVVATLHGSWAPPRQRGRPFASFIVYQRMRPDAPHYSPNFGFEGGVFLQFIATYYDHLPNQTILLQDELHKHNSQWYGWARCVLPTSDYAPLTAMRLPSFKPNGQVLDLDGAYDAITEQCWRDLLETFNLGHLLPPRVLRRVNYFSGSLAMVSRSMLQRHPRGMYVRAHAMFAGGDGRCVQRRELNWPSLAAQQTAEALQHDTGLGLGKHTSAAGFEGLQHVILGGMGLQDANLFDFCSVFKHQSTCRFTSPCPSITPTPRAVDEEYQSPLFTPELRALKKHMEDAHQKKRRLRLSVRQQNFDLVSNSSSRERG